MYKHMNTYKKILDAALSCIQNIDRTTTKVVWFGLDSPATIISVALQYNNQPLDYITDNNPASWGLSIGNFLTIFPVEQIAEKYGKNAIFLISSKYAETRKYQLQELGIEEDCIFMLPTEKESFIQSQEELLAHTQGLILQL